MNIMIESVIHQKHLAQATQHDSARGLEFRQRSLRFEVRAGNYFPLWAGSSATSTEFNSWGGTFAMASTGD